jgi:hypothetical protein
VHRGIPLILGLALAASSAAIAQSYVTQREVFFRRSPSMTGAKLATLAPGETLSTRSVDPRSGWVPLRRADGKAGWVGRTGVRILHTDANSGSTTVPAGAAGQAATRIDPAWEKPPITKTSIQVQDGAATCGPTGEGTDDGTNLHKDRADVPQSSHLITLDAIRSLPDTALWRFKSRVHWTHADSALVIPYEGIPVTVEGYFEIVKPQQTSAPAPGKQVGESPNCHSWAEMDTDWHMALVAEPTETESRAVVVEPTPRTKRQNSGWTPAKAEALAVRHSPHDTRHESDAARVRVTGFLMLDPVHPDHIAGHCKTACAGKPFYRATLWEVHPVTKIEVLRGETWVDLNDLPPQA